ncbi:hypothetical protein Trydic_g12599 [Trypoxylus dichotomus]
MCDLTFYWFNQLLLLVPIPMVPEHPPTQTAAGTAEAKMTTTRIMTKTTSTTTTADQQAITSGTVKRAERGHPAAPNGPE